MKPILLVLSLLAVPLAAQEQKAETAKIVVREPDIQKVFILKYADPNNLRQLFLTFGGTIAANPEMHALAVTAPAATMRAFEDAIARLDVPSAAVRNFDFTVELLVGSDTENSASTIPPKDLDSVIAQLKAAFPFKNYRLMDVMTLRTRAGSRASTRSSGGQLQAGSSPSAYSTFSFNSASLGADGSTVHVERLQSQTTLRYGPSSADDLHLDTDLDIKEGQKVVVGRMGIGNQQALFMVLTVKVVQ